MSDSSEQKWWRLASKTGRFYSAEFGTRAEAIRRMLEMSDGAPAGFFSLEPIDDRAELGRLAGREDSSRLTRWLR